MSSPRETNSTALLNPMMYDLHLQDIVMNGARSANPPECLLWYDIKRGKVLLYCELAQTKEQLVDNPYEMTIKIRGQHVRALQMLTYRYFIGFD